VARVQFTSLARFENVERTLRRGAELLDHMGINHRRLDARVPEVSLNLTDVHAVQQQVRREAVSQRILTLPMNRRPPSFTTVTIRSTANT